MLSNTGKEQALPETTGIHHELMRRCLELARQAREQGNTPVGSLVVLADRIIGEGIEQVPSGNDPTGHAEILACREAIKTLGTRNLDGAVLYSTAEPCLMCSYVIRQSGIAQVVYGLETPMIGGATSSLPILTAAVLNDWKPAPHILGGVLAEECRRLKST